MADEESRPKPEGAPVPEGRANPVKPEKLDRRLFFVVSFLIGGLILLLVGNLYFQHRNYGAAIEAALTAREGPDHSAVISHARALDFTVVKTSTVFIGFLLVLVGALYLLRVAEASYSLGFESAGSRVSLQTASPGLVMISLGVIAVLFALYAKSTVRYESFARAGSGSSLDGSVTEAVQPLSFAPGATELSETELTKVDRLCEHLRKHDVRRLTVEGYGDPNRSHEENLALGDRREAYLRDLLVERCSWIPQTRTLSHGAEPPGLGGGDVGEARIVWEGPTR